MEGQMENDDGPVDGYDAVPRDGPAVFLANVAALERGELSGTWVRLDQPATQLVSALAHLIGDRPDHWAVVDQVGAGSTAVDEDASIDELVDIRTRSLGHRALAVVMSEETCCGIYMAR